MTPKKLAQELLTNPLLPRLLDEIRADLVVKWESSDITQGREDCWFLVKALETVREHVESRIREIAGDGGAG